MMDKATEKKTSTYVENFGDRKKKKRERIEEKEKENWQRKIFMLLRGVVCKRKMSLFVG